MLFPWRSRSSRAEPSPAPDGADRFRYPPFPRGLPVTPVEAALADQADLIGAIRQARGLSARSEPDRVARLVDEPVRHYARMVHLLPATEKSHYRAPGGLLRMGLEAGLHAIRTAETRVLTTAAPETRRDAEALWVHAVFLAGLYSEAIRAFSRLSVYSDEGRHWHPGAEILMDWLEGQRVKTYHLRWAAADDRALGAAAAAQAVPMAQAKYLALGERRVLSSLMGALYDLDDMRNPIVRIVQTVRYKLIERDLAGDASRYGEPAAGMHLEPWLIDAMRHLVQRGRWTPNAERARLWCGRDGVFLVWPAGAHDLQAELRAGGSPFVPREPSVLKELLQDAGILEPAEFDIAVPAEDSGEAKLLRAVRFTRAEILFPAAPPPALDIGLIWQDPAGAPGPAGPGTAGDRLEAPEPAAGGEETEPAAPVGDGAPRRPPPAIPAPPAKPSETAPPAEPGPARHDPAADERKARMLERLLKKGAALAAEDVAQAAPRPRDPKRSSQERQDDSSDRQRPSRERPSPPPEPAGDPPARARRLAARLRPEFRALPDGTLRLSEASLVAAGLDLIEVMRTFKAAGWLKPVDGLDVGLSLADGKPSRFLILIPEALSDGEL